jgi:hypothetical protein
MQLISGEAQSISRESRLCKISIALLFILANSCATYEFKNYPAYGSIQSGGAAQFDTLDDKSSVIPLADFISQYWDNPTDPLIALHVSAYEDLITGFQTVCSDHPGACSVEVVQKANHFLHLCDLFKRKARGEQVELNEPDPQ